MNRIRTFLLILLACCMMRPLPASSAEAAAARTSKLEAMRGRLQPLQSALQEPLPGDWRFDRKEPDQTFKQYLKAKPATVTARQFVLYVQPLGDFDESHRELLSLAADFMGRYFHLPVKTLPDLTLSVIPESARRVHPTWGGDQIQSLYVLNQVLPQRLPADGTAIIAFTSSDLWPGEDWNFVFGQASLEKRVGVWSFHRFGDPAESDESFRKCLLRTLKVATHETGHMFSLPHCVAYQCNMNGSNSLAESDRQPLEMCSECVAKLCWATGADPRKRLDQLMEFCKAQKLNEEYELFKKSADALGSAK